MTDKVFRLGDRRYKADSGWADDAKQYINNVSAVSSDKGGDIYLLQRSDPFMLIFNTDGKLVYQWSNKDITDTHYLDFSQKGEVFVVERDNHRIDVFSRQGEMLSIIGDKYNPGNIGRPFNHPSDISFTKQEDFFVS